MPRPTFRISFCWVCAQLMSGTLQARRIGSQESTKICPVQSMVTNAPGKRMNDWQRPTRRESWASSLSYQGRFSLGLALGFLPHSGSSSPRAHFKNPLTCKGKGHKLVTYCSERRSSSHSPTPSYAWHRQHSIFNSRHAYKHSSAYKR